MKDFNYYAPTEVVFGEQSEEQVAALVKKYGGTKVLVHYGGQSAQRSGLLDKICGLLKEGGIEYITLGGVKVCNATAEAKTAHLDLSRFKGLKAIATKRTLTGAADAENNYDAQPIAPVDETIKLKKRMDLEVAPYSFTMITINL